MSMAETTYDELKYMSVGEILTAAASVGNDEIEAKITELVGEHWGEIDCAMARLADQLDARQIDIAAESAYSGLEDCF
jgi:hypothetical protein